MIEHFKVLLNHEVVNTIKPEEPDSDLCSSTCRSVPGISKLRCIPSLANLDHFLSSPLASFVLTLDARLHTGIYL